MFFGSDPRHSLNTYAPMYPHTPRGFKKSFIESIEYYNMLKHDYPIFILKQLSEKFYVDSCCVATPFLKLVCQTKLFQLVYCKD